MDIHPEEGGIGFEIEFPEEDLLDLFLGELDVAAPEVPLVEEEFPVGLFLKGGIGIAAIVVVLLLLRLGRGLDLPVFKPVGLVDSVYRGVYPPFPTPRILRGQKQNIN